MPLLELAFCPQDPRLLKKVVNYAISQCPALRTPLSSVGLFPNRIFSCETLIYLKLYAYPRTDIKEKTLFPKSFNFPALTTLHLGNFSFCAGNNSASVKPFSTLNRLNSLVLYSCALKDAPTLCISSLCTPSIGAFAFIGKPYQKLFGSSLSYVNHVDIYAEIRSMEMKPPSVSIQFCKMLMEAKLQEIKSRKEAAKLRKSFKAGLEPSAPIPDGIINFLLQNSPSAQVYMVDC
ncbi:cytochrome C biogenesis protein ccsA, putative [Medicago truncatula]|uniref:Cytochrome C biogenesis protein ccsA, putative n=1 Tax=Medicago truncatula TaxID=3880 RepID=G7J4J5_MEDTR|nr:cytochrome C biogenesis protein ccsA, putative [Medicago truncatula]